MLKQPLVSGNSYSDVVKRKGANNVNTFLSVQNSVNTHYIVGKVRKPNLVKTTSCGTPHKRHNINRVKCIGTRKMPQTGCWKSCENHIEIKNKYSVLSSMCEMDHEKSNLVSENLFSKTNRKSRFS